jgi:hypothetical protein
MFLTKWKMTDFPNVHLNTSGSVIRCIGIPFKRWLCLNREEWKKKKKIIIIIIIIMRRRIMMVMMI